MIAQHDFNTLWWGEPVGVVRDSAFFQLSAAERARQLAGWQWVEYRERAVSPVRIMALATCGFRLVDTHVTFRIRLSRVSGARSSDCLSVNTASEELFEVLASDMVPFAHERFLALPGATPARVAERYAMWSARLIRECATTCLRVSLDGNTQGWFLSSRSEQGLHLSLAVLHRHAVISGSLLYQKALSRYSQLGHALGHASFGAANKAVLNVYASLGARFTGAHGNFIWHKESLDAL